MHLQDVMSRDVETVTPEVPAEEALARMKRSGIHHLVVADRDEIVGIVSSHDLALAMVDAAGIPRVGDFMTQGALTASPQMTVLEAANVLRGRAVGCLPVLEYRRLVGIVTISDKLTLLGERGGGRAAAPPKAKKAVIVRRRPAPVPSGGRGGSRKRKRRS